MPLDRRAQPVTILRPGAGTDDEGRPAAPATVATASMVVADTGSTEREAGGDLSQQTTAQAITDPGVDVRAGDLLTTTFPTSGAQRTYRVVAVHDTFKGRIAQLLRNDL